MREKILGICAALAAILVPLACSQQTGNLTQLQHYSLDDLTGLVAQRLVVIDREISHDGRGSVRITTTQPVVIPLFEAGDLNIEDARLIYRASIRTEDIQGRVYLEMLCHFPEQGEFFSRGLEAPLSGTTEWSIEEIPFFLQEGQNPDNVKLNLVIDGTGTAWIDDIHLLKGPLVR